MLSRSLFVAATILLIAAVLALTVAESNTWFSVLMVLGGGCGVGAALTYRGRRRSE